MLSALVIISDGWKVVQLSFAVPAAGAGSPMLPLIDRGLSLDQGLVIHHTYIISNP